MTHLKATENHSFPQAKPHENYTEFREIFNGGKGLASKSLIKSSPGLVFSPYLSRRGLPWHGVPIVRSERPRSLPAERQARQVHRQKCRSLANRLFWPAKLKDGYFPCEQAVLNVISSMQREAGGKAFAACESEVARRAHVSVSTVYRTYKKADTRCDLALDPMSRDVSRRSLPRIMRFTGPAYDAVMKAGPAHRPAAAFYNSTAVELTSRQYVFETAHIEEEYKERRIKALETIAPGAPTLADVARARAGMLNVHWHAGKEAFQGKTERSSVRRSD